MNAQPVEKRGSYANDYRSGIRSAIRGLWSGAIDRGQFTDVMDRVIERGLGFAFAEGASGCGIVPDDYTDRETKALEQAIANEQQHVDELADAVQEGSKANGGKLDPLNQRGDLWILRYQDVVNQARVLACGDQKFKWVYGDTVHCPTCLSLNGLVHRGSQWRNYVMPQEPPNDLLCCGGWRCRCKLEPTTERATTRYPPVPGDCK